MTYLLSHNRRIEEDLVDQLFNSSEKRLARVLLLLAHFGKAGKPEPVIPKMSQKTLAEMIGTTRSRISFFMGAIKRVESKGSGVFSCLNVARQTAATPRANGSMGHSNEEFFGRLLHVANPTPCSLKLASLRSDHALVWNPL